MLHIPIVHAHDVNKQIPREKNFPSGWKCYKLRLEQLLRIFRALQTSQVLHISMNAQLTYESIDYNIASKFV